VRELVADEHHLGCGCLTGYPRDDIPDVLTATGLDHEGLESAEFRMDRTELCRNACALPVVHVRQIPDGYVNPVLELWPMSS
jgi:hypothetical protein